MQILLSFFLLVLPLASRAECRFKAHASKIYSLSGVTSVALKEMGLLNRPAVKGISVFNPIGSKDFTGMRYPGGIFLSRQSLGEFGGGILFFDESIELSRILLPMSSVQGIEIKTRGMSPLQVSEYVALELSRFVEGCEKELLAFVTKTKTAADHLLKEMPTREVVYFLGEVHNGKLPEMVIVQDGVVKWLLENKKIKTYPSSLAYVNWSAKIMNSLSKKTIKIAVKDSGREMIQKLEKKGDVWELTYPGSLLPGLTQLEAWAYFEQAASP